MREENQNFQESDQISEKNDNPPSSTVRCNLTWQVRFSLTCQHKFRKQSAETVFFKVRNGTYYPFLFLFSRDMVNIESW